MKARQARIQKVIDLLKLARINPQYVNQNFVADFVKNWGINVNVLEITEVCKQYRR